MIKLKAHNASMLRRFVANTVSSLENYFRERQKSARQNQGPEAGAIAALKRNRSRASLPKLICSLR
jgi:hypothetical protein